MNGDSASNSALLAGILAGAPESDRIKLLVCPPFPYLAATAHQVAGSGVSLEAQTVSENPSGAFTGEVSISMLSDLGCEYVIVGHSERRSIYGETSEMVAAKFKAVKEAGLVPILCVGETLEQREADETENVIGEQLNAVLETLGAAGLADAVVAYEPVWAIGTGMTASPEQAQDVHAFIRQTIASQDAGIADKILILRRQREREYSRSVFHGGY